MSKQYDYDKTMEDSIDSAYRHNHDRVIAEYLRNKKDLPCYHCSPKVITPTDLDYYAALALHYCVSIDELLQGKR